MDASHYYGQLIHRRTAGAFIITESAFPAGLTLPVHAHEDPYFTLTLHGSYREQYGLQRRLCTAGTAVAHPARESHSQQFAATPALLLRVAVTNDDPEIAAEAALERPMCIKDPAVARTVAQLHGELACGDDFSEMVLEGLAYELVGRALQKNCSRGGSRKRALCARTFIDSSLRRPLSPASLSKALGVSRTTLYRDFKSAFGCAPGDYLRQVRIEAAAELLRKSARAISEISAECGFFDQSHFDRCFRLAFRVSPTQYRQMERSS